MADRKPLHDGRPAFPGADALMPVVTDKHGAVWVVPSMHQGMTLRDWFAGQALAGLMTHRVAHKEWASQEAYRVADAMLAARIVPEAADE